WLVYVMLVFAMAMFSIKAMDAFGFDFLWRLVCVTASFIYAVVSASVWKIRKSKSDQGLPLSGTLMRSIAGAAVIFNVAMIVSVIVMEMKDPHYVTQTLFAWIVIGFLLSYLPALKQNLQMK
ncbi:MAG TPA: hypothetical protein VJ692_05895, partial [Nitrospiraceae bacterium]|nr:hypothetical protein [Nitrospiraceae bacterium]